jgi:hypothetical protein
MKRKHRQWHRLAWLLLTPAAAAALVLALLWRVAEPVNKGLPALLAAPAAKASG